MTLLSKRNSEYVKTGLLLPLMLSLLSHVEPPVVICNVVITAAVGIVVVVAMVIYDEVTTAVVIKIVIATVVIRIVIVAIEGSLCLQWFRHRGGVELICL